MDRLVPISFAVDSRPTHGHFSTSAPAMTDRNRTLDVFRGATVALMILVNNPGSWASLYPPLAHATWHGWTLTDLVFPFFLFAVGNAIALTPTRTTSNTQFWKRWTRRTLLIFGIGLLLNVWPFVKWGADGSLQFKEFETLRIMGVLQRIALCWACAALIVRSGGVRAAWFCSAFLLIGYWWACVAFAHGVDPYSLEGFFGTTLDRVLLGESHLYRGEGVPFDPEGLASTTPAIAQVLLGYAVGHFLLQRQQAKSLVRDLLLIAIVAAAVGSFAHELMPINKKLWTSSYALLTTGLATLSIAVLLQCLDRWRWQHLLIEPLLRGCEAFGRNALLIFALTGLVPRTLALIRFEESTDLAGNPQYVTLLSRLHREFFAPLSADPRLGSFLFAVVTLLVYWLVAEWLHRRRWYFKA